MSNSPWYIADDARPVFAAPRDLMQRKPAHGAPCTRCGLCCMATLCPLGQAVFKPLTEHEGPCPGLVKRGDDYLCGVAEHPERYSLGGVIAFGEDQMRKGALHLIGSGEGCDARFNGELPNHGFYARIKEMSKTPSYKAMTRLAKHIWRVP